VPIEIVSPGLEHIVSGNQEIEELGNGYTVAEGPLWWREEGYLLFNEVRGNRRRKWSPRHGVTLLKEPSNNANGLTRDPKGRLLLCEGGANRVTRVEPDGEIICPHRETKITQIFHNKPLFLGNGCNLVSV